MSNKKQNEKKKLKHRKSKTVIIIIIRFISNVLFWLHCVKFSYKSEKPSQKIPKIIFYFIYVVNRFSTQTYTIIQFKQIEYIYFSLDRIILRMY